MTDIGTGKLWVSVLGLNLTMLLLGRLLCKLWDGKAIAFLGLSGLFCGSSAGENVKKKCKSLACEISGANREYQDFLDHILD